METKICKNCKKEKLLKEFTKNSPKHYSNLCRPCSYQVYGKKIINPLQKTTLKTQTCVNCKKNKNIDCFNSWVRKKGGFGYYKYCILCHRVIDKERHFSARVKTGHIIRKPFFDEKLNYWVKFCKPCKTIKPLSNFKKDYKNYWRNCNSCLSKEGKEKYAKVTPEIKEKNKSNQRLHYKNDIEIRIRKSEQAKKQRRSFTKEERYNYHQKCLVRSQKRRAIIKKSKFVVSVLKSDIIRRDGLHCYLCEIKLSFKTATIDHVIPLSRGGDHKPENIKIACKKCNTSKHNKFLTEYKKWRGDYEKP